jgi:hypothetical protein
MLPGIRRRRQIGGRTPRSVTFKLKRFSVFWTVLAIVVNPIGWTMMPLALVVPGPSLGEQFMRGRMQQATFLAGSSASGHRCFSIGRALTKNSSTPRESKTAAQSTIVLDFRFSRYPAMSLQSAEVATTKSDSKSVAYEFRTKSAKSGALETNRRRERILGLSGVIAVRRFSREARGYWASMRAREPAENVGRGSTGGGRATVF